MPHALLKSLRSSRAYKLAFQAGHLLYITANQWMDDNIPRLGAALAFYSILSLGPLLLLMLAGAATVFGHDVARGHIIEQSTALMGDQGSAMIQDILTNASPQDKGVTTWLGIGTLLFGASGVFGQLQDAFNTVWKVQVKSGAIIELVWNRILSFLMVLGTGLLMLLSLVLSAIITAISTYTTDLLPILKGLFRFLDTGFSIGISTLMFALIFKYVPDAKIRWKDVWVGASLTALLFTIGKYVIGLYLGHSGISSSYGAAGSAVVLLIWIYYSAQILLFGAEFTQVYAHRFGAATIPAHHAQLREPPKPKGT